MSGEAFARAENSSDLEMEPESVRDVDRVIALAGGNVLGGLLFRVREGGQPQWSRRVVLIVARRMIRRYRLGRQIAERAAACALEEFVFPYCRVCGGAREIVGGNLRVECHACQGSGKQRYSDGYRKRRIGCYGRVIDRAMAEAHHEMTNALGAFLGRASGRMG